MTPNELNRSILYASLIATSARPMSREDFECDRCRRDKVDCRCFRLPENRDER